MFFEATAILLPLTLHNESRISPVHVWNYDFLQRNRTTVFSNSSLQRHIVSDIESIANHVIMIKEKQLLKNDTVPNICKELEGKVFEKSINESEIQEFEQKRIILSMRQESEKMMVRYYSEEEDNNARPCTPNLEDVFLVTYREEK